MNRRKNNAIAFIVFVCIVLCLPAFAKIENLTCEVSPSDANKKYNKAQNFTIKATWKEDASIATSPFAATFKDSSAPIGSVFSTKGTAEFTVSAMTLSEGTPHTFGVEVVEAAVPNPTSADQTAAGSYQIDKTPPQITLSVISGQIISPVSGFNEVVVQFTSTEELAAAPEVKIEGLNVTATSVIPETSPFMSNQYKFQIPSGTSGGTYIVKAKAKDKTEPSGSENEGTGQTTFQVDAAADGTPTINSSDPKSPTRSDSMTLSGSVSSESGSQKIEVLEGDTVKGSATIAAGATEWSITLSSVAEGTHTYAARRTDPLGNVSPKGNPFPVVVDRTAPAKPVLAPPKTPVNTSKIQITGTAATDEPHKSLPVKVCLFREGTQVAEVNADAGGNFTFDQVELQAGLNLFFAQAADTTYDGSGAGTGNQTTFSAPVQVVLDQTAPVVVNGGVIISSPGSGGSTVVRDLALVSSMNDAPTGGSGSSSRPLSFEPPLTLAKAGSTRIYLPGNLFRDRYQNGVSVSFLSRDPGNPLSGEIVREMTSGETGFSVEVPAGTTDIAFRFQLKDPAGNATYVPPSGEFRARSRRQAVLRLGGGGGDGEDVWPVETLGLPSLERLLAYRRAIVPAVWKAAVQQTLSAAGKTGLVEIVDPASVPSGSPAAAGDLESLKAGSLPASRVDLLLDEIRSGVVPVQALPDPTLLPADPVFKDVRDAIQFQRLHEKHP